MAEWAFYVKSATDCQRQRCKHVKFEQCLACFHVAWVCQRQLGFLVHIINKHWCSESFLSIWQHAVVLPIPKADKDKTDPCSYRPIALTSYLCKIVERMINGRLVWYREKHKLITNVQWQKHYWSTGATWMLCTRIFHTETTCSRSVFDLEKAYDTTWKYGIMEVFYDAGLGGRLPFFNHGFLENRLFQVRLGSYVSDVFDQKMGVQQGSILSVTLFALKINSIVKSVSPSVDCCVYMHDFLICYHSKFVHIIEWHLQQTLNKLQHWVDTNGFKFSESKTVCIHFCRLRKDHPDPVLVPYGTQIPVVEQAKFLRKKLTVMPHLHYLRQNCMKVLNMPIWNGSTTDTIIYGSERKSYLRMLDPVHNQALLGCSLNIASHKPACGSEWDAQLPMELRRRRLASQYSLKISSNMNNPARNCALDKWFTKPFDKCLNLICPSGLHVKTYLSAIGFKQKDIFISSTSTVSPWLHTRPSVNLSLCNFAKSETNPDVFKCKFLEICDDLGVFCQIYAVGSKTNNGTAAAAVSGDVVKSLRITVELVALNLACLPSEAEEDSWRWWWWCYD